MFLFIVCLSCWWLDVWFKCSRLLFQRAWTVFKRIYEGVRKVWMAVISIALSIFFWSIWYSCCSYELTTITSRSLTVFIVKQVHGQLHNYCYVIPAGIVTLIFNMLIYLFCYKTWSGICTTSYRHFIREHWPSCFIFCLLVWTCELSHDISFLLLFLFPRLMFSADHCFHVLFLRSSIEFFISLSNISLL